MHREWILLWAAALTVATGAQAGHLDVLTDPVEDTVDGVTETVAHTVDGATDAVDGVVDTVEDTTGLDVPVSGDTVDGAVDPLLGGEPGTDDGSISEEGGSGAPVQSPESEQPPGGQSTDGPGDGESVRSDDAGSPDAFPFWGILAIMGGAAIAIGGTTGYLLGRR